MIGNRCLEEGAEEFFLKPVQLSDVNRLRPHMLKTKLKCDKPERREEEESDSGIQSQALEQQQPQHQQQHQPEQEQLRSLLQQDQVQLQPVPLLPTLPPQDQEQLQLLPPTPPQQSNNNKRKAMEDGLSPDRTRPRYNGITTMV